MWNTETKKNIKKMGFKLQIGMLKKMRRKNVKFINIIIK